MTNKHMKSWPITLVTGKCSLNHNAILLLHTPKMATILKFDNIKCWSDMKPWKFIQCRWEYKLTHFGKSWALSTKAEHRSAQRPRESTPN